MDWKLDSAALFCGPLVCILAAASEAVSAVCYLRRRGLPRERQLLADNVGQKWSQFAD